jgi:hypothetical protein
MASHNSRGRSAAELIKGHSGQVDLVDSMLVPIFAVATLVTVGIGNFEIFGLQADGVMFSLGATNFTFAFTLAVLSLAIAAASNMPDTHRWTTYNWGIAVSGVALLIALEFMPDLQGAVSGNDYMAIGVFVLEAAAFYVLAYL